jgi:diguanylate cyclase (GGDEF)-like protein/PAS domain S-box-containing protein
LFKDEAGRWLESNQAMRSAFQLEGIRTNGKTDIELAALVHSPYKDALLRCDQTDKRAWELGTTSRLEEKITALDGNQIIFDILKVPLFHHDGGRKGLVIVGRDVSELRRKEELILAREQELITLTDNSPELIIRYDTKCRRVFINPTLEKVVGIPAKRLLGITPTECWSFPEDVMQAETYQSNVQRVLDHAQPYEWEVTLRSPINNDDSVFLIRAVPEFDREGKIQSVLTFGSNISGRKRIEKSLRISSSVFNNANEAIIISDSNNNILDVNNAFTHITGYSREEVLGLNPRILSSGRQNATFYKAMWRALKKDGSWRGEVWNRRKSGEVYAEMLSISVLKDDSAQVQRYVAIFSDISHIKAHEEELSRVANFDALTNLPNRRLLADRLNQAILTAQRSGKILVVCYMDIDGFKQVNDLYGHDIGDRLLIAITKRLQDMLRAGDTLARLGGDEFVMLFNQLSRRDECLQLLDRILEVVEMPVTLLQKEVKVSASIGVAFYDESHEDGDSMLRQADQAMYAAKQMGKNRYHLYDANYDLQLRKLHELRLRIAQGLKNNEFELFYQPKIELGSNRIYGAEALIRWNHPDLGLLSPAEFLPSLENSDLEIKLGEWVIKKALAQSRCWSIEGLSLEISINISPHHILSDSFAKYLEHWIKRYPLESTACLQIEILETTALEDISKSSEIISACKQLGVSFAIDDFGTGYSSLAYLRKISADTLKIDQSFVRNMLVEKGDLAIVQGIIALAKTFGLNTVAEGIERSEHAHVLKELGCMYGQGYGISKPIPANDFATWYASWDHLIL